MASVESCVRSVRRELRRNGSAARARQTQRFFKHPVKAYGWTTAEVRGLARRVRQEIAAAGDAGLLFDVAERLFAGPAVEESTLAVSLLQGSVRKFGEAEFRKLGRWVNSIRRWDACDGLCICLLGPLVAVDAGRVPRVLRGAKSKTRWSRRAAAVSLVVSARKGLHTKEMFRLAYQLLEDEDEMVQKAVAWLLREACKKKPRSVADYLHRVRGKAPRPVLREASAKLSARTRKQILSR